MSYLLRNSTRRVRVCTTAFSGTSIKIGFDQYYYFIFYLSWFAMLQPRASTGGCSIGLFDSYDYSNDNGSKHKSGQYQGNNFCPA